jgi:hypothetical protein
VAWEKAFVEAEGYTERQRARGADKKLCGIATRMMSGVTVADRYHHFNKHTQCFVGVDAVKWIMADQSCSEADALQIGHQLINLNLIHHCRHEHSLCKSDSFFRFNHDMVMSVSGSRVKSLEQRLATSATSSATTKEDLVVAYLIDTVEQLQGELSVEQSKAKCLSRMNRRLEASIKSLSSEATGALKRGRATHKRLVRAVSIMVTGIVVLVLLLLVVFIGSVASSSVPMAIGTVLATGLASPLYNKIHHVAKKHFSSPRVVKGEDGEDEEGAPPMIPASSDGTRPRRTLSESVLYRNADAIWAVSAVDDAAEPPSHSSPRRLFDGNETGALTNESSDALDDSKEGGDASVSAGKKAVHYLGDEEDEEGLAAVPERYIRGCGGEYTEAKRRWDLTLQWRQENAVDSILSEPQPHFSTIKECYPHFFHGRSNGKVSGKGSEDRSYVVYYEKLGELNLAKLKQKNVSVQHILRHFVFISEYLYTHIEPDNQYGKCISVLDVTGVGLSDLAGDALEFLKENSKVTQSHYVERCQKIFVVNASYMFTFLWRMVQPLINENTRQKVSILGSDFTELVDYVGVSQLPEEYGGPKGAGLGTSEDERALRLYVEKLNYVNR